MRTLGDLCLLLACVGTGLFAQTSSITGNVTDPTESVIPGATITFVNLDTGAERTAIADPQGRYTVTQMAPGFYKATAKAPGFADVEVEGFELRVSAPSTLEIKFE